MLTAEGEKQAAILRAEGNAQAAILNAEGEARAILQVFDAIHEGDADPKLLAYQYLQMLPKIADGTASKLWVIPTEFTAALGSIAQGFGGLPTPSGDGSEASEAARRERDRDRVSFGTPALVDPAEALAEARRQAEAATADATSAGTHSGLPFDPQAESGQRPGGPGQRFAPAPEPGTASPRPLGPPAVEDEPTDTGAPEGRP